MISNDDNESFKTRDATSYDNVVGAFDHFTTLYTGLLAKRLADIASINGTLNVLDVGTGTGVVVIEIAKRLNSDSRIIGIDLSEEMLKFAEQKAVAQNFDKLIEFRRMDAETLEFDDNTFDKILSLYALFHFPNPDKALSEMFRVVKPGGQAVVALGTGAPLFSGQGFVNGLKRLNAVIKRRRGVLLEAPHFLNSIVNKYLPSGNEPEESSLAQKRLNSSSVVIDLFRSTGFEKINWTWQGLQPELKTPEEFWELQTTFSSMARKRLAEASEEKISAIRNEFMETCRKTQQNGGKLIYPYGAFYVSGIKPVRQK